MVYDVNHLVNVYPDEVLMSASGARLALTAARQLQASGGRYALVSPCIGVGQGIAAILERVRQR